MSTADNLEARALLERAAKVLERTSNDTLDGRNAAIDIRDFLARSVAPAKELSDEEIERIIDSTETDLRIVHGNARFDPAIFARECFRYARDNGYLSPAPPSGAVVEAGNAMRERLFHITEMNIKGEPWKPWINAETYAVTKQWDAAIASSPSVERVASPGLVEDARAVLNRWDSPQWEWDKHGHTAGLMANLRKSVEASPSVDEQTERILSVLWDEFGLVHAKTEERIHNRIKALLSR